MTPGQASQTAQFTAILRAYHHLYTKGQKQLEDSLALALSGLPDGEAIKQAVSGLVDGYSQLGNREVAAAFVEQIEHSVCIRSRLVEERLRQTKDSGLEQLVFLGAGMDSTAYRCTDLVENLTVIEVDHPDTQSFKQERLEQSNIPVPENLHFVGFDFENETLAEALAAGGVDQGKRTLFAWLGVNMYLTEDAIDATLSVIQKFPVGSELVADFLPDHGDEIGEHLVNSVAALSKQVAEMGEPMESKFTPSVLESKLLSFGFCAVEFYSGKKIVDELLGGDKSAFAMPEDAVSLFCARL